MKTNTVIAFAFAAGWLIACQPEQKAEVEASHPVAQEQIVIEEGEAKPYEPGRQVLVAPQPSNAGAANATGQVRDKLQAAEMSRKMAESPPVMFMPHPMMMWPTGPEDHENYGHFDSNPVKLVSEHPVSTFSIDVDTGSYANVRRMLREGRLPPQDAVRVEEMINYFSYGYQTPSGRKQPFRVTAEMAPAPWNAHKQLLHIGIKGFEMDRSQLPPSNLVFLVDVSGSMHSQNKLPLLKQALIELTNQMTYRDRISLVVYAGASGVVLPPTPGNDHGRITEALNNLYAGGSTNGADGIRLAYRMAESAFIKGGVNRVILATDGDFNVGTTNFEALVNLVEQKRKTGISLTALGFGTGNYNDRLMEQIADHGNGNYAYIDSAAEARKVLVDEIGSTLMTIAKDVKIQIEFNPATVSEYRLIGYENRMLKREDFNNDAVDAGEIGAGHTVTALYEVTLAGGKGSIDPLRYGDNRRVKGKAGELALLRLRYKQPDSDTSSLIEYPLQRKMIKKARNTTDNFRFSAAVAAFGDILRGSTYTGAFGYNGTLRLAASAKGNDRAGYRKEFMQLVRMADSLDSHRPQGGPIEHGDDGLVID